MYSKRASSSLWCCLDGRIILGNNWRQLQLVQWTVIARQVGFVSAQKIYLLIGCILSKMTGEEEKKILFSLQNTVSEKPVYLSEKLLGYRLSHSYNYTGVGESAHTGLGYHSYKSMHKMRPSKNVTRNICPHEHSFDTHHANAPLIRDPVLIYLAKKPMHIKMFWKMPRKSMQTHKRKFQRNSFSISSIMIQ